MVAPTVMKPTIALRSRGVHCTSAPVGGRELYDNADNRASFQHHTTKRQSRSEALPARETRRKRGLEAEGELARKSDSKPLFHIDSRVTKRSQ